MNNAFSFAAGERNSLRVFALDMTAAEVQALRAEGPSGLAAFLGVGAVDPGHVEIFDVADLGAVGLAGYLIEGNGLAEAQIAADRGLLEDQRGFVLIVFSGAFRGVATTLRPSARLALIGSYAESVDPVHFAPLPFEDADGMMAAGGTPMMSNARVSGMVAAAALVVLFALTALLVWLAG